MNKNDGEIAFEILKGIIRRKTKESIQNSSRQLAGECGLSMQEIKAVVHRILYDIVEETFTEPKVQKK